MKVSTLALPGDIMLILGMTCPKSKIIFFLYNILKTAHIIQLNGSFPVTTYGERGKLQLQNDSGYFLPPFLPL